MMSDAVNYGLLAFSAFLGAFVGKLANDLYEFCKCHFKKVHACVR